MDAPGDKKTDAGPVDLLVVGGGINGAGIARDAAGRGLAVALCERADLASATSSASSKLIHGGLRYLEHFEFRLVREALIEREVLLSIAPHIIRPMTFVLPHHKALRPAWMIRAGLWIYDHLGRRRRLHGTRRIDLKRGPEGAPLKDGFVTGFAYADGWVDDARLVVLNALDAHEHGARIMTRTELVSARRKSGLWHARLRDGRTGREFGLTARVLINAAGPWVEDVIGRLGTAPGGPGVRLVKGSHIVVPRLHDGDHAYILQNADGRVVFVIPFEGDFSLIGTTDVDHGGAPDAPGISTEETRYLCDAVNGYFRRPVGEDDVVWSFSGLRPLFDDGGDDPSAVTRDYTLALDEPDGGPPLLSVFGGKITTYRELAEKVFVRLAAHFPDAGPPWTATRPLPGGDLDGASGEKAGDGLIRHHPWLPADLAGRYARQYGTRTEELLSGARSVAELGAALAPGLHAREAAYLVDNEWAETAEDILWRRTKLGLAASDGDINRLADWLGRRNPALSEGSTIPL